ncbi:hypothetical protein [Tepidiforma sp.]|uniref:hypothetical protein n=1 Tax=Tepidiforma sp. TaxID=2682230 RepID=UPI0021DD3F52|nr:hypothetical protein [Tepidiforma sp.]MCX7616522.1 hypothetical protein [Tepidiforma sp.]GIW19237.1 MAG: hypothetical protein KatS3mg064_2394 [Tepidiforma sp.]
MTLRTAALLLRAAAVGALGFAAVVAAREIAQSHRGWALDALGWAALLMVAQVALLAAGWRAIGRGHWPAGERWTWLRSFAHGWAARYVPGPPTGPAGKYLALRDAGMAVPAAAALLWVDQVLSLAAGIAVPAALAVPAYGAEWLWAAAPAAGCALALAAAGARPGLVRRVSGRFGPRGEREGAAVAPRHVAAGFAAYTAAAFLAGLAFHVTAVVVSPWPLGRWEEGVLVFSLASLAGYVTPFAPSGAGVRESLIVALLGGTLGAPAALTVAVVARATAVLVDAVLLAGAYGAGWLARGASRRHSAATASNRRA